MRLLRAWLLRFQGLFLKNARERELADELESHLQMHIDDNISAGMSPQEARRVAVGSGRTLWSDCLLGQSTYTRDRGPHRAGRATQYGLPAHSERSECVGACRNRDRDRLRDDRCDADAQTALRHTALGSHDAD